MAGIPQRLSNMQDESDESDRLATDVGREVFCYGCGGVDGRTSAGGLLCHDCREKDDCIQSSET